MRRSAPIAWKPTGGHRLLLCLAVCCALAFTSSGVGAAAPRHWFVSLTGPDRVSADQDYRYTVTLTNDSGAWPASANASGSLHLTVNLTERYPETTVGIEDILVHPIGPQNPDGLFPCAPDGACGFTRTGPQVDFVFPKSDATVPPIRFDILVHTASIFRPGDGFTLSAILQSESDASPDTAPNLSPDGEILSATLVAVYPAGCAEEC